VFEEGLLGNIPKIVDDLDLGKRCLVVDDEATRAIAGEQVRANLEEGGYQVTEVVIERADDANVAMVNEKLQGFDFSIAVGGGTPIDVTKMAACERGVPFISFPTAMSHDGIASPIASITANNIKSSRKAYPPICVMSDLGILLRSPARMTAAGCGDLLAKLTSLKDWELGRDEKEEYYCEKSADLAFNAFNEVAKMAGRLKNLDQAKNLAEALVNCGVSMILAGSSRPASGSEHLFSHYLDRNAPRTAMHGEQCALGTVLLSKYHAEHNQNWWKQSEYRWQNVKSLLERLHVPVSLSQLGVNKNLAIQALTNAARIRPERYTILHKKPPSVAEATRLVEETSAD
jgi:glycerol-1-phosphate dehydrogenase [NAD(P)+]